VAGLGSKCELALTTLPGSCYISGWSSFLLQRTVTMDPWMQGLATAALAVIGLLIAGGAMILMPGPAAFQRKRTGLNAKASQPR
jgi:lipopolysaccharide/colanic/teichoic acid biosynthesis glycosyltransferase